ncbi:MAG: hypothetical protein PUP91_31280 [Rhizonema sp. PD37]|nr:hypothetical protein [Rhizonema sp. PD37]
MLLEVQQQLARKNKSDIEKLIFSTIKRLAQQVKNSEKAKKTNVQDIRSSVLVLLQELLSRGEVNN